MEQVKDEGLSQVKAVYDDGHAEINGRRYEFLRMKFRQRRSVFAFFSSIQAKVQGGDFSFLDEPGFAPIEKIINDAVSIDGSLLSRLPDHWDEHPEDYLIFVSTALGVISFPFLGGGDTGSPSQAVARQKT